MPEEILFEVLTPLNFTVRTTKQYWELITTVKHPTMKGKEELVKRTLNNLTRFVEAKLMRAAIYSIEPNPRSAGHAPLQRDFMIPVFSLRLIQQIQ